MKAKFLLLVLGLAILTSWASWAGSDDLQGKWLVVVGCEKAKIHSIEFNNGTFTVVDEYFADDDCTQSQQTLKTSGSYAIKEKIVDSPDNLSKLDLTVNKVTLLRTVDLKNTKAVAAFDSYKTDFKESCGKELKANTELEVTGVECVDEDGEVVGGFDKKNTTYLNSYIVKNSRLYLADLFLAGGLPTKEEDRFNDLVGSVPYLISEADYNKPFAVDKVGSKEVEWLKGNWVVKTDLDSRLSFNLVDRKVTREILFSTKMKDSEKKIQVVNCRIRTNASQLKLKNCAYNNSCSDKILMATFVATSYELISDKRNSDVCQVKVVDELNLAIKQKAIYSRVYIGQVKPDVLQFFDTNIANSRTFERELAVGITNESPVKKISPETTTDKKTEVKPKVTDEKKDSM